MNKKCFIDKCNFSLRERQKGSLKGRNTDIDIFQGMEEISTLLNARFILKNKRKLSLFLDSSRPDYYKVEQRVLQESVLRPLLFIVFIN